MKSVNGFGFVWRSVFSYLKDVKTEMANVTWPTKNTVQQMTATVLVVSIVVGLYIGGLDAIFTTVLNKLLTR